MSPRPAIARGIETRRSAALLCVFSLLLMYGQILLATPADAAAFSGGLSPTISASKADLNASGIASGRDDANDFYGETDIIDGHLDCDAWDNNGTNGNDATDTGDEGPAGDGVINGSDDCTLIGVDGTADGVEIQVVNGLFVTRDGVAIPNGTALPTVFNDSDPDNADVGDSDFAWSTIGGRIDANGDETIDGEDCHLGLIGQTVDVGLGDPHDGADVLASDGTGTNQCTGLAEVSAAADDGLVDLNSDGNITLAGDTCNNACVMGHNVKEGVVQTTSTPDFTVPTSSPFTGGFSPSVYGSKGDLNGDGTVTGRDDSNAFYGDTHIIDGMLDCDAWTTDNDGAAGDGQITGADDCTLIGYDGSPDGVEIAVVNGQFALADNVAIPNGTPLPTVFNAGDPDNADVGDSDFAWSTIGGRVDSNGDETIDGDDCHLGLIGQTVDSGLGDPHDGADVLASDGTGTNQCTGLDEESAAADDGLVDLNSDGNITFEGDTCSNGCFFGHDVLDGVVQEAPEPADGDRPGVVRDTTWFLNNDFDGNADITPFRYGTSGDIPITGDWDGDGDSTPGIIRGNTWFLNNDFDGNADITPFPYGRAGDIPVVGDWDGDGDDTPGVVRGNTWFLNNGFDGASDVTPFAYGSSTDFPIAGDWNGDDDDTPGVVRGNTWFLNNGFDGASDVTPFRYGSSTDFPIAGDWDGDGDDTPGVVRGNTWFLNNDTDGNADITPFPYGRSTDFPITGDWNG